MAYKIKNKDFFKKSIQKETSNRTKDEIPVIAAEVSEQNEEMPSAVTEPFRVGKAVCSILSDSQKLLMESGFTDTAQELERVKQSTEREHFTIAVTGEFSRGKSSLINKLLERDFLPVGDLPTTAVMTRILYHQPEVMMAFDENNKKKLERKLSKDAWKDLVIHNFGGEDFLGWVVTGINSGWLKDSNIEIIDTPGAGDLSESRAREIGDMLLGCDGAIITISATAALSLTEKLFIEERLLARKIPFLLLAVTKLDLIRKEERAGVIRYIKAKLRDWGMDIPVFIPYAVEIKGNEFDDIIGLDKIRQKITQWSASPERVKLTEDWLLEKTEGLLEQSILALNEKKILLEAENQEKRYALISEKNQKLAQAELIWGDYRLMMQQKCSECYRLLVSKVDEYAEIITERLQYEVSHSNNPQKWWNEDFPYRIKIELTNLSVNVENFISRQIEADVHWYSSSIEKTFHSYVLYKRETISDKELFGDFDVGGQIEFADLDKQRNAFRIGAAVLSITGVALFSAIGFLPIVATVGIGTGTTIASEKIFRRKVEDQKDELKQEIARLVPAFIQDSMRKSEKRLENVYSQMISEAEKTQNIWLKAQKAAIKESENMQTDTQGADIGNMIEKIQRQIESIHIMTTQEIQNGK